MSELVIPVQAIKGRGAATQMQHRFEQHQRGYFDDGWSNPGSDQFCDGTKQPEPTQVLRERVKRAITRNESPDVPFSAAVNPYRGCEHGCIYCYARPTHSYLNLSPGLDFESKIIARDNIVEVLRAELTQPSYRPAALMLG